MKIRQLLEDYNNLLDKCHKITKDAEDAYDHYEPNFFGDIKSILEDFVRNLPPKYNLVVKCNYPDSKIFVFDGKYEVLYEDKGELIAQLPKGLYKLTMISEQFNLVEAKYLEIVETHTLLDIKSETKEI